MARTARDAECIPAMVWPGLLLLIGLLPRALPPAQRLLGGEPRSGAADFCRSSRSVSLPILLVAVVLLRPEGATAAPGASPSTGCSGAIICTAMNSEPNAAGFSMISTGTGTFFGFLRGHTKQRQRITRQHETVTPTPPAKPPMM